ncbi:hypothetical protein EPUS_02184 [Endocarpon pusillum Z07020]|uniref:PH domain-containing protein n=1 Tax=Endocarpon pusillum (strain Z07020 / HMAS-L-300199) TaxID=1263415 RepID=U1G4Q1_ENDPU|nr:uncharacterized protein EPUS_02184 [Endocarpon pusillum Z07020]ERF72297.1 hypothetical protein EPUS_02184 [Endocarpon pusillum Z07020]
MDHTPQAEGVLCALPTPTDTPYRTPPRSRSRQSRRHGSASPDTSSSPVHLLPNGDFPPRISHETLNSATDEKISPLDPRRFTPSLHASLVSEILSLRREVENKTKDIEHLEASLHRTRNENESLLETVASSSEETRSIKRQMQILEGGSLSAMSELSKERDEALNDSVDLRKRLELSQKKIRAQEESAERTQVLWERDRGNWEREKRGLETKVHVVEGRLKVVLNELGNTQVVNGQISHQDVNHYESPKKMHLRKGSTASMRSTGLGGRRRDSEASAGTQEGDLHGYRLSYMNFNNGHSICLADELAFDEVEEDQINHDARHEEQISADELPEERPVSSHSRSMDQKARKILGLAQEDQFPVFAENEQQRHSINISLKNNVVSKLQALYQVQYVDAATQYSPPSPKLWPATNSPTGTGNENKLIYSVNALSHKDPAAFSSSIDTGESPSTPPKPGSSMVSSSCQTSSQLPSPPRTPLSPYNPTTEDSPPRPVAEPQMISRATQTDRIDKAETYDESKMSANDSQKLPVPIIAIHPPASRPATPTSNVVLPPQTKNASCQVNIRPLLDYTSSSMQTEEIRIDTRTGQLPQRLLPFRKPPKLVDQTSSKSQPAAQATSPLPNSSRRRLQQPGSIKPATSRRRVIDFTTEADIPPSTPEVEEPVMSTQTENVARTSELSASYGESGNQMNGKFVEQDQKRFDEDDIFSRPTAKFTLKAGKLVSKNEPEADDQDVFDPIDVEAHESETSPVDNLGVDMANLPSRRSTRGNISAARPLERKTKTLRAASSKQPDIRKAALISSGAAAHQFHRDRSPSAPAIAPPFAIPTRHSSRKPPQSLSEGARSPTPTGRSPRKRDGKGRKPSLRKVKSTTNVPRPSAPGHQRSSSPPLPPCFDFVNDPGPVLPPLPSDNTTPPFGLDSATVARRRGQVRHDPHSTSDSARTILQQTSVVDAIAQTMVGEWMYKYIRRRKSFGVPEPKHQEWDLVKHGEELSASITNTGVRHKRWVWLAPYERAVMWSSKQPTSGSALMGKSGRKLDIQSVLDVRDDNLLPKASATGPQFNRSILILTPERALKFTATSQDRHYVWLTALSFLSHSPLGLGDLAALPSIPQQEYLAPQAPPLGGSLRRNPIRDSIRVAKGRGPHGGGVGHRSFTTDGVIAHHRPDREAAYEPPEPIYIPDSDAADPPTVPRYSSHSRHRSNTASRAPAPSFRNFSSNHSRTFAPPPPATYSMTHTTTADLYTPSHHNGPYSASLPNTKTTSSRRGSEASAAHNAAGGGYSDHVTPTMRMTAFIAEEDVQRPHDRRQGRKKNTGYWGAGSERTPAMTKPGIHLPDEVVSNRSRSSTRQGGHYPGTGMSTTTKADSQIDGVSIGSEDTLRGTRLVIQEDWESDDAHVARNHFRGF